MLNERTQAKIGIINTDTKKIAAALLECIAPENLPQQYGGTCPLDLGESEEEADLRAYVASLGGSCSNGTAPASGLAQDDDEEEEVVVDIRAAPRSTETAAKAAAAARAGATARESRSKAAAHGDGREESGPGPARRVVGSVRGALGWAGGKLAWRRSPVAHLGDDNGFEYDAEQHRWVLRGEAGGGGGGGKAGAGGDGGAMGTVSASGDERGDKGDHGRQFRPVRVERNRSVSSEEMTVLAIQVRWGFVLCCVLLDDFCLPR